LNGGACRCPPARRSRAATPQAKQLDGFVRGLKAQGCAPPDAVVALKARILRRTPQALPRCCAAALLPACRRIRACGFIACMC